MSFRGFFAEEELFEVQPAPKKNKTPKFNEVENHTSGEGKKIYQLDGSGHNELAVGHFVTSKQLQSYKKEEIVCNLENGNPRCYKKGSFIYRLAG